MRKSLRKASVLTAVLALSVAALTACGDDADDNGNGGTSGAGQSVTIGYIPWDEDIAVSYLWEHVMEEAGYDVTLQQLDVAPTFVGLTEGDLDLFFDTWLPTTHEDYWEQYGDQLEDLGSWYDQAKLTIAVPDYLEDINSIGDLAGNEDLFDGNIVGIESGAGLTRVTRDEAMPTYDLDGFNLQTSSTAAMLAALKQATDAEDPIVVTLWRPHWAYAAFPIKDLEDPEGAMGGAEQIHNVARLGFTEDFPELAEAIKNFSMNDEQLASLEQVVLVDNEDDYAAGVDLWVADNQEFVDGMLG